MLYKRYPLDEAIVILLRIGGLICKFLFTILIIRALPIEDIGYFGLFNSTLLLSLYVVGADFYTYSNRELIKAHSDSDKTFIVYNHIFFCLCSFLLISCIIAILSKADILFVYNIYIYIPLLFFEYINQEIFRILTIERRYLSGQLIMFIKQNLWSLLTILYYIFIKKEISLSLIIYLWTLSNILGFIYGVILINQFKWLNLDYKNLNKVWILQGIKISSNYLIGTISTRSIFFFDKYILNYYQGAATVGIYTFFQSVSNSIYTLTEASVISKHYPRTVNSFQKNSVQKKAILIIFIKKILKSSIIFSILIYICSTILIYIIKKNEYYLNQHILAILLFANIISLASQAPHYALYGKSSDKTILRISALSLLLFIVLNLFFTKFFSATGTSICLIIISCYILIHKWINI